jgi:RNA polymerase sigma-70 factor (ECF subfamily)
MMLAFLNIIENEVIRSYLEELYLLYRKDLVYEANKILKDYHEAEDIVQTAFIKVADYLDENIDVKCNKTKGLIVIIVRRLSINQYHKRIRRATTNIDDLADVISDDSIMMPEINILRLDQSQEVARLLDNINEGYADILTLKYLYEYTDKEIAEIIFMSEGSVRTKLTRARQACKDVLGGERYEYA